MAMPPALKEALDEKNKGKDDAAKSQDSDADDKDGDSDPKAEAEKSLSPEDLSKALSFMESFLAKSEGRKGELLRKSLSGGATEAETAELAAILVGGSSPEVEAVAKSLDPAENEALAKSIDSTGYLDDLHSGIVSSHIELAEVISKSREQQDEFNQVMAAGLLGLGVELAEIRKSLGGAAPAAPEASGRVAELEAQVASLQKSLNEVREAPVGEPRGLTGAKPAQTGAPSLSKSEVSSLLQEMLIKSVDEGRDGLAKCGEDLTVAASSWELHSAMSGGLRNELLAFRAQRSQG